MKIPAVDVGLGVASAVVLLTAAARALLPLDAMSRSPEHAPLALLAALVSLLLVAPLALVAYVLYRASTVRATAWRRVAAQVTAGALALLCVTTALATEAPIPSALTLSPATAAGVSVALLALSAAVYRTSPARRLPRPPRRR